MNRLVGKKPEHETIYAQLREQLLFGEFVPGQPLTIHGLAESIGSGVTPIREAIRRLTAEGALVVRENRRVEVPDMTYARLEQIELVRVSVEPVLAMMGAKNNVSGVAAELERLDQEVNHAIEVGDIRKYLEANYRFHFTLYAAADAEVLLRVAESLWLQIGPALRVGCGRFGTANLVDQHHAATVALRVGDFEAVRSAFEEDIRQGMKFVSQTLK
ncbi:transcriptional regulator, GntR family [Ruegeria halocynthiae]|uniref:Transcriptional regulator, GntR family n=2 Tax=Ruegeria halocynthiae TaxID=985054 RepID=A0A1H2YF65_9RHOB|nr:transcriptional regulator, GntR family [Ruegeria halocynthiae]